MILSLYAMKWDLHTTRQTVAVRVKKGKDQGYVQSQAESGKKFWNALSSICQTWGPDTFQYNKLSCIISGSKGRCLNDKWISWDYFNVYFELPFLSIILKDFLKYTKALSMSRNKALHRFLRFHPIQLISQPVAHKSVKVNHRFGLSRIIFSCSFASELSRLAFFHLFGYQRRASTPLLTLFLKARGSFLSSLSNWLQKSIQNQSFLGGTLSSLVMKL